MFGDIVGRIGRRAVAVVLPALKKKHKPDFIMANVENLAHGVGVTPTTFDEILEAGVDFCTSGNHIWDKPEVINMLADENIPLLRPANYPSGVPGRGVALVSLSGKQKILIVHAEKVRETYKKDMMPIKRKEVWDFRGAVKPSF